MKVTITKNDIVNLNKFMLIHSKKAKKMRMISFYAIAVEFILLGLFLDWLFKKAPMISGISVILAGAWVLFFPKFYNKIIEKNIAKTENLNISSAELNLLIDDKKLSFSPDLTPKSSEIFYLDTLRRIVCTNENYFLAFSDSHIVLPKNEEIAVVAENLSKKQNIKIENLQI